MGYRDKKNPWHVLFDKFKEENPDLVDEIKMFHPVEYPVIKIDFKDGRCILYHGETTETKDIGNEHMYKVLFDLIAKDD